MRITSLDGVEWGVMLNGNPTDFSDENYVKCSSEAQAFLISNTMNLASPDNRERGKSVGYAILQRARRLSPLTHKAVSDAVDALFNP